MPQVIALVPVAGLLLVAIIILCFLYPFLIVVFSTLALLVAATLYIIRWYLINYEEAADPNDPKYKSKNKEDDPIHHVVVLMLENQSFDHILGALKQVFPECEGIPDLPASCEDSKGKVFTQHETRNVCVKRDLGHELDHVKFQIEKNNAHFVKDIEKMYPDATDEEKEEVMGYYPLDFLPATHTLARNFKICDHWFSSVPGPTWPNRLFVLSGTSKGICVMYPDPDIPDDKELPAFHAWDQPTIFDRLTEKGVRWKVYYSDCPLTFLFTSAWSPGNMLNYRTIDRFYEDCQKEEWRFPQFAWLEPKYGGADANDDHPPHDTMQAQALIAKVYNALRANDELWKKTLFIITYDEHGGYYDHVVPPVTIQPDEHVHEFHFQQLGVRVPFLLVSPWVNPGIDKTVYDHTSLLKYLIDKWDLNQLGNRAANANTFAHALKERATPRDDTPERLEVARPGDAITLDVPPPSDNSIHNFAKLVSQKSNRFAKQHQTNDDEKTINQIGDVQNWQSVEACIKATIENKKKKEKINTKGESYVKRKALKKLIKKHNKGLKEVLQVDKLADAKKIKAMIKDETKYEEIKELMKDEAKALLRKDKKDKKDKKDRSDKKDKKDKKEKKAKKHHKDSDSSSSSSDSD
jgi:phospholipase C